MTGTRLPHSEIPGSKRACRSPRLIAACRVLHRLPSPRHPSCALTSLTTKKSIRIDCRISGAGAPQQAAAHPRTVPLVRYPVRALFRFPQLCLCSCQRAVRASPRLAFRPGMCRPVRAQPAPQPVCAACACRACRVPHPAPLSDRPRARPPSKTLVGVPGVEPGTSSLSGTRSNQLSYTPRSLAAGGQNVCRPPEATCCP